MFETFDGVEQFRKNLRHRRVSPAAPLSPSSPPLMVCGWNRRKERKVGDVIINSIQLLGLASNGSGGELAALRGGVIVRAHSTLSWRRRRVKEIHSLCPRPSPPVGPHSRGAGAFCSGVIDPAAPRSREPSSPPASQVFQFSDMKLKPSNSGQSSPVIGMIKILPAAQLLLGKLRYLHLFLARDQQN